MITRYHAKYYAMLLSQTTIGNNINNLSQSLLSSTVDINPHQIDAALFAFQSPLSKGVVLADEVGLGKTIEAGLVVCQYWSTGKKKIIVVCPASLRKQWEVELHDKFGLASEILDSKNYNSYIREGKQPFKSTRIVICSYNFAGRHKNEIIRWGFDLAVIDEAHKLRNVYRKSARTSADVRDALSGVKKLLLTATPFQNSLLELYGLTTVIDEHIFGSEKSFRSEYGKGENLNDLRQRLEPLFTRTLRKDVKEYINYTNRLPLTQKFKATDAENELYQEISDFLRRDDIYSVPAAQRKLTTMIIRKIMASSIFALISTLQHIKARLERILEANSDIAFNPEDLIDDIDDWGAYEDDVENEEQDMLPVADEDAINIPKLKAEIKVVESFIKKAEGIKLESKSGALLIALKESFKKLAEEGANRKALIFTESTKTQEFLKEYLEENGYEGKIVLFNGKAKNPQGDEIYKQWAIDNPNLVSGIKSADRRAAIVDYFEREAEIMIATEAAAEGLNLQFCSTVINYDLPWNPQRIEQRIGRCHRYGQKFDVVVVNFVNTRNYADVRVFQLLSEKFKLFDSLFGASDEVLGRADNIDIEGRIWEIYQQCRSNEEINAAFEKLQEEMQSEIEERMDSIRTQVIENFDINVQEHLRTRKDETGAFLNRYQHIFWELTKFILSSHAVFNNETHTFILSTPVAGQRRGRYALLNNAKDALPYRLNSPLGQHVINSALSIDVDKNAEVKFDETALEMNANLPEHLHGKGGYLMLALLSVKSLEDEQYVIFNGVTDDGRLVTQDECEKMFLNGGTESGNVFIPDKVRTSLEKDIAQHTKAKLKTIDSRNLVIIRQEEDRIYAWEHDMMQNIENELTTIRNAIMQAERDGRAATSVQEKLESQRKVEEFSRKRRNLRNDLYEKEEEISEKRQEMIEELEKRMIQSSESNIVFTIHWRIK